VWSFIQLRKPYSPAPPFFVNRRIMTGEKANARVLLKAYPARRAGGGKEADAMAANEFRTLARLQPPEVAELSPFITKLLGGFQATEGLTAGEQWLVFRFDGTTSAADYAAVRSHTPPHIYPHAPLILIHRVACLTWNCGAAGGGGGHE